MAFNLSEFQASFQGGARPNLFNATITGLPEVLERQRDLENEFQFLCTTGELPGSSMGVIPVSYFGRTVNYAGNRIFAGTMTTTILNEENFALRLAVESWHEKMNSTVTNIQDEKMNTPESYTSTIVMKQHSRDGENELRAIRYHRCWPTDIGPIILGWEQNDTIEMFDVTWQYDWWESQAITDDTVTPSYSESVSRNVPQNRF